MATWNFINVLQRIKNEQEYFVCNKPQNLKEKKRKKTGLFPPLRFFFMADVFYNLFFSFFKFLFWFGRCHSVAIRTSSNNDRVTHTQKHIEITGYGKKKKERKKEKNTVSIYRIFGNKYIIKRITALEASGGVQSG